MAEYISQWGTTVGTMMEPSNMMSYLNTTNLVFPSDSEPKKRPNFNNGIIISLLTFFGVGTLWFFVFCIVRRVFHDIYASRRYLAGGRPPKLSAGFLSWIPQVILMPENVLISTVGIDGAMLLRFFSMCAKLFSILTIFGFGIMGPVNYYSNPPSFQNSTGVLHEDVLLPALTMQNVPDSSPKLYIHLVFTWCLSILVYITLASYFKSMSKLKNEYDAYVLKRTKMSKIDQRSVMVFGIPSELCHEVDLAGYFESLGIGKVENVVLCRRWSKLQRAVEKRAKYLLDLEAVYSKILYNLYRDKDTETVAALLKESGLVDSSFTLVNQNLLSSNRNANDNVNPWQDVTNIDSPNSNDNGMSPIDLINGFQRTNRTKSKFRNDIENQNSLEADLPYNLKIDYDNPNVKEIMARLEVVDHDKRPTHRVGFLGLIGKRVDSACYYAAKFCHYDKLVKKLRRFPERSQATSVGFVTFESPESAILASQINISTRPFVCLCRQAPEPRDIYWRNLSSPVADSSFKLFRNLFVIIVHLLLVFFSTVVIASINVLVNVDRLEKLYPPLQRFFTSLGPRWYQFIKGVVPAVGVSVWTGSLPTLLIFLSKVQGLETESWIDQSVLSKYFFYQFYNILLVQTIVPNWMDGLNMVKKSPAEIIDLFGSIIPTAAPLQINYVMLQATAVYPAQLLLIGPLLLTWALRFISRRKATSREISDAYYPSTLFSINYGIVYPVPILVFCIGIVYAPVAPLILPFCTLFFIIAWFIYRYILLYVNIPRYESVGKQTPMVVKRCLVGVLVMQLTMMGALALKAGKDDTLGYFKMMFGIFPLVCITIGLFWWFKLGYERVVANTSAEILGDVATQLNLENYSNNIQNRTQSGIIRDSRQALANLPLYTHDDESISKELSSLSRPRESDALNIEKRRKSISRTTSTMGSLRIKSKSGVNSANSSFQTQPYLLSNPSNDDSLNGISNQGSPSFKNKHANELNMNNGSPRALSDSHLNSVDIHINGEKDEFVNELSKPITSPINLHGHSHSADAGKPCVLNTNPWEEGGNFTTINRSSSSRYPTETRYNNGSPSHTHFDSNDGTMTSESNENKEFSDPGNDVDYDPTQPLLEGNNALEVPIEPSGSSSSGFRTGSEENEDDMIKFHVEPPMSRLFGILDAPFGAATAVIPAEEEQDPMFFVGTEQDDLTLHTYLHPALVGRLPITWLPDSVQSKSIENTRKNQRKVQKELYKRTVNLLQVGVRLDREEQLRMIQERNGNGSGSGNETSTATNNENNNGDGSQDSDDACDEEFFAQMEWRGNRWEQRSGRGSWIKQAVNGFSGWLQVLLT